MIRANTWDSYIEMEEEMNPEILRQQKVLSNIKKGIWLYFWLLILEGALRKWVFPSLATPLLIVRDPVAIGVLFLAFREGIFTSNAYTIIALLVTFVSFLLTLFVGHGDVTVAVYGARIMLIQFPLLFVIGTVFTYEDAIKIGRVLLIISPFMTILMAMQFYSPQSAWVNRGIGGDVAGGGFSGAMGFFRPPGTFSFITGLASFYGFVAIYVVFFWLDKSRQVNRWLLVVATGCMLAAIPMSISRTLLFEVVLAFLFGLLAASRQPSYIPRMAGTLVAGIILFVLLSNFGFFQTATEAFISRFESADRVEGGLKGTLGDRFLGGMITAVTETTEQSLFVGKGLGMGTNAGAKLMTGTNRFLISEGEWGRIIGEMGLVLGLATILLRVHLIASMTINSIRALRSENFLPWMLIGFSLVNILQGQWAQPASLGFAVLSGGLILAALKGPEYDDDFETEHIETEEVPF
ncbi:hypothetical protein [Dyadobacter psychrophilus]|uniref:O-antigen ligase like membrane protein n=1 Tax=Dyadobacter psychrophilus TaxID=651661 RepID=A0A1T5BUJ8_9BACT|nr:hypothetical protein [Dyadobacter psychrophilus]SKB50817.1 hypothetical protein SAMN05660293_00621 [Dyadobacter psychrophilus]